MRLLRKYKRRGLSDSAYELYKDEINSIDSQYGLSEEEKNSAYESAYERLEKNSIVANIDGRRKSGFNKAIKTYLRRHPDATLQDYIDRIEDINAFKNINDFLSNFDSDQIKDIYESGRGVNMTDEQILDKIEQIYDKHLNSGLSSDQIFNLLLTEIEKS